MSEESESLEKRQGDARLFGWLHPSVIAPAGLAAAAGFAQFAATASLADVAAGFGLAERSDRPARPGLNDTTLGLGLSVIRLGSLAAMPLAAMADRVGRRRIVATCATVGLALTAAAALSPGFWWFVAVLALARPLLSATNAVAIVVGAEVTTIRERAKAVSVIGATYAVGAGIPVLLRAAARDGLGFRGIFALAAVPLALAPIAIRHLKEPDRYQKLERASRKGGAINRGRIPPELRSRLLVLAVLTAAAGFVTGPANTFVFYFAERIRGLSPSTMAIAVVAAGPIGLVGLIAGRWTADNFGRRLSAGASLAAVAGAAIFTYNVAGVGVAVGYLLAIFSASVYTPASGAISAELFPTSCRSAAAGWVTAAGVL
ncbi:MAG: MFS transporter, partial [Actinomycetota bacterium]|nr:MFS transporter [Actinomycetota bacterium]